MRKKRIYSKSEVPVHIDSAHDRNSKINASLFSTRPSITTACDLPQHRLDAHINPSWTRSTSNGDSLNCMGSTALTFFCKQTKEVKLFGFASLWLKCSILG